MTEEIIVNGVDVSKCGFLDNHRQTKLLLCNECNSDFAAMECKDYHDCYYKQLKRLEQENKKLKEKLEMKEKLEKIKKVILRCKEANCTNCEYQAECNFNGDDFDDFLLRIIEGAKDEL